MRAGIHTLLPVLLVSVMGCDDVAPPKPAPPPTVQSVLSAKVMRAMLAPGEGCFRAHGREMPASYQVLARVERTRDGFLSLALQPGGQPAFDACIVDAIRGARIPVELAAPVEVPLAFHFAPT